MKLAGRARVGSDALHVDSLRNRGDTYPSFVLKYSSGGDPHVTLAEIGRCKKASKPLDMMVFEKTSLTWKMRISIVVLNMMIAGFFIVLISQHKCLF